jgi:indoleamine 2,3-dioxygenase
LVKAVSDVLDSAAKKDNAGFKDAMTKVNNVMTKINAMMEEMWEKSLPEDYGKFRAFIMGIISCSKC